MSNFSNFTARRRSAKNRRRATRRCSPRLCATRHGSGVGASLRACRTLALLFVVLQWGATVASAQDAPHVSTPARTPASNSQSAPRRSPTTEVQTRKRVPDASTDAGDKSVRASNGSLTGRVLAEDGQPLAGVSVRADSPNGVPRLPLVAVTDEEGKFRIDNLEPAAYTLLVGVPGYVRAPDPLAERGARPFYHVGDFAVITLVKGGVVTGTVTNASGEPVVAVGVRAVYVRDLEGRPGVAPGGVYSGEQQTDDRGVYRIYGLPSGVYVVAAGGGGNVRAPFPPSAFDADMPTYYPSQTRDGATEINVRAGQETGGIDIRYRGERGHTISGTVSGASETGERGGIYFTLTHVSTGTTENGGFNFSRDAANSFSFEGVADGDYDVTAYRSSRDGDLQASAPRRVNVRGADVTGLTLALLPLASVSGRVKLESPPAATQATQTPLATTPTTAATTPTTTATTTPTTTTIPSTTATPAAIVTTIPTTTTSTTTQTTAAAAVPSQSTCEAARGGRVALPSESVVILRRRSDDASKEQTRNRARARRELVPDARGEFAFRGVEPGSYRVEAVAPGDEWYVRAVTLPSAVAPSQTATNAQPTVTAAPPAAQASRTGVAQASRASVAPAAAANRGGAFTLRNGERLAGLGISFAYGAAALRGQLVAEPAGAPLPAAPARLRVHLVPVERERAEDALRFAESAVTNDAAFAFSNVAPGRYRLLVRVSTESESQDATRAPLAFETEGRARLRREAEANGTLVELQSCQRIDNFTLRPTPTPAVQ